MFPHGRLETLSRSRPHLAWRNGLQRCASFDPASPLVILSPTQEADADGVTVSSASVSARITDATTYVPRRANPEHHRCTLRVLQIAICASSCRGCPVVPTCSLAAGRHPSRFPANVVAGTRRVGHRLDQWKLKDIILPAS